MHMSQQRQGCQRRDTFGITVGFYGVERVQADRGSEEISEIEVEICTKDCLVYIETVTGMM
jgi:hypothetical protein